MKTLSEAKLRKIADCLEEEEFDDGHCIIKQGAVGDLFFIIRAGEVRVTKTNDDGKEDELAVLGSGDFFGDKALIKEDKRSANVYAKNKCKCYTLDRTAFINLVGRITDQGQTAELDTEAPIEVNFLFNQSELISILGNQSTK